MIRITPRQWKTQAWKNGGGVTHEILCEQDAAARSRGFTLRVSVAEVASDGPFSRFPGIDRNITLLEGNGFRLTRDDGVSVDLRGVGVPFAFHGEDKWTATLIDGPVRDFNVMVDRRLLQAGVQVQVAPFRVQCGRWLLFAIDRPIGVEGMEVPEWGLVDGGGSAEVSGLGRVMVVGLTFAG